MSEENLQEQSALRILFLLNLLYEKPLNKDEITLEFKKSGVELAKSTLNNYIEKLKNFDIPIEIKKEKNVNYYFINKEDHIELSDSELECSRDVKKLLLLEKNPDTIRKAMRLFYKFALRTRDEAARRSLTDFDFYSKIDWKLVKELKNHAKNNDLISIEYIKQDSERMVIKLYPISIEASEWSDRIYLNCIFRGSKKFSKLPLDKIFKIKETIETKKRIDIEMDVLTYRVAKDIYKKTKIDKVEHAHAVTNSILEVERPLNDDFRVIQRLMYFCPELYYISDENIKNKVIEKLNELKDTYCEYLDE